MTQSWASGKSRGLLLLWLCGVCLRLTILAVPPLLGKIHHQLHLTEAEVGALTALPVLLLALAAVPGSLLVARLGARRAMLVGLGAIAVGGALRSVGPSIELLFVATFVMGCGVAVCQPSLPSLVRGWAPGAVGLATAGFTNGMLIGEIIPVVVTAPFLLAPFDGSWRITLAFWSIPVAVTIALVLAGSTNELRHADLPPAKWWPDWLDSRVWLLGLTLGGAAAAYWGANAFIPELLRRQGHGAYITAALTSLNLVQLPASFAVAAMPKRLVARVWPLSGAGLLVIAATAGILFLPPAWTVADLGILGLSTALVFVLALAMPPLVADPGDTHRISAAIFAISYLCPFAGSLLGGALWDISGTPELAFTPLFVGGLMVLIFPRRLDMGVARSRLRDAGDMPRPLAAP